MIVLGIDPGHEHSAWVAYETDSRSIIKLGINDNATVRMMLKADRKLGWVMAIEMVGCYGMAVGREVFETCVAIGRFEQCWEGGEHDRILRQTIKAHLCNSTKANDSNIRRALMDRWGGDLSVKKGGPLAGIKTHLWAALACAVAWAELKGKNFEPA